MIENAFDDCHVAQVNRHTVHAHVDARPEMALYGQQIRQNMRIATCGWRLRLDRHCSRGGPHHRLHDDEAASVHFHAVLDKMMSTSNSPSVIP